VTRFGDWFWGRQLATAEMPEKGFGLETGAGPRSHGLSIPSPWQTGSLSQIVWNDVFGLSTQIMTREQAMTIPGVARGRGILLSLIADKPIVAYRGSDRVEPQPLWLYRVPGWQGPWTRMARTIDDHIFHWASLWGIERGSASAGLRPIINAWHIPFEAWTIDEQNRICTLRDDGNYEPADESEVLLIPGPSEGLLAYGNRTLRGSVELEDAWIKRAKNPIPAIDLHETVESGITQTEAQEVVDSWAKARNDPNGAIAYTPYNIEASALGQLSPDMFIEARNAARLDIAAFFQIPGSLLDATTATASLTYVTQESATSSLDTLTIPYWVRSIEDRLSQDDVVPIGQIVRFAWGQAYTEPPGPIITSPAGHPAIQDAAAVVGSALGEVAAETLVPDRALSPEEAGA
jgi:hypothetical protein